MIALITGASSGIGRDIARVLSQKGWSLILVARRRERLEALKEELKTPCEIITADLEKAESCFALYEQTKSLGITLLINSAGFGLFGEFYATDLARELSMLDLNIRGLHILTKLFLKDFIAKDEGYILNVASSAAFLPGPLLSSYYASKAYVLRLSEAIYEELRQKGSAVSISVLCPGPVETEFNHVANVNFSIKGLNSTYVAEYAIKKLFKRKLVIVPGIGMKTALFFNRLTPQKLLLRIAYHIQRAKRK